MDLLDIYIVRLDSENEGSKTATIEFSRSIIFIYK